MNELLLLSNAELETLLKRLTHYALRKMLLLTWRGAYVKKGGAVPGAYEPQDFANDAIGKMLDGSRKWNKTSHPTIEEALRATIDSDISHLVESLENRRVRRIGIPNDETDLSYDLESVDGNPVTIVVDREWKQEFRNSAMKLLVGEPDLERVLECMDAGFLTPTEIADILGITSGEVNNLLKRLRRRLDKLDPQFKPSKRGPHHE